MRLSWLWNRLGRLQNAWVDRPRRLIMQVSGRNRQVPLRPAANRTAMPRDWARRIAHARRLGIGTIDRPLHAMPLERAWTGDRQRFAAFGTKFAYLLAKPPGGKTPQP